MSYDRFKVALRASLLALGITQASLVLLSLNRRLQGSLQSKAAEPSARFKIQDSGFKVQDSSDIIHQTSDIVHQLGMERFAKGLMWVMKEALGMPQEWMLWEPDEKEGHFILAQVMEGGNFGQYVEGYRPGLKWNYVWNLCRRNVHLLRWYPSEALWAPVWIVWHKLWKIRKRWQMRRTLIVKGNR